MSSTFVRRSIFASLVATLAFITGCAIVPYAREVKKKPTEGGVVAMRTHHTPEDRAKAESMIASNCGANNYKILEEGEVVVGEKTHSTSNKSTDTSNSQPLRWGSLTFGSSTPTENTNTSSETVQIKEWQISYQCNPEMVAKKAKKKK